MRTRNWIAVTAAAFIASTAAMIVSIPPIDGPGYALQKTIQDIRAYSTAIKLFRIDHRRVPTEREGLSILTHPSSRYIEELKPDFWETPYFYQTIDDPDRLFSIHSVGPNRLNENGLGDDVIEGAKDYPCAEFNMCRTAADYGFLMSTALMLVSFVALVVFPIRWLLQRRHRADVS